MLKNPFFLSLAVVLGLGLAPLAAGASQTSGRISLSFSLGAYQSIRLGSLLPLPQTADVPDVKVRLDPESPEVGFTLGLKLSRRFELQVEQFASRAGIIDDVGIGFAGIPLGEVNVSKAVLWTLGARLLYGFGVGRIVPYLAAGIGITTLDTEKFGAQTRPSVEFGAGLKARISESLRVVLDVRDTVSFFRYFEDFRILYAMIYSAEVQSVQHRPSARLGLGYIF